MLESFASLHTFQGVGSKKLATTYVYPIIATCVYIILYTCLALLSQDIALVILYFVCRLQSNLQQRSQSSAPNAYVTKRKAMSKEAFRKV